MTRKIFQEASMNIREWTSNHLKIMNHVEQQGIVGKRDKHVLGLQWTTKEDQLSLELFTGSSLDEKENLQPVCDTFWLFRMNNHSNTQNQTLYKRHSERKLDMGRGTTETEERMEPNCRRFSQCNNIRKTKTHTDYTEKLPGHLCG